LHLRAVWLAVISLEKNMNMKTIEDVFIHLLSDTYSAEKQLTRALAKLARATSNEKLSQAFHAHLEEIHGQIERIDQVVESESNLKIKRMKCVAMEGLIEEANEVIESTEKNEVRDAALIAAAQKVEHYEIASYGTLATLAEQLGYRKAAKLLKETLEEEKATDIKLTDLAINNVNKKAENKA
jgi:ferritin-like metal-binding protein YciE